MQGDYFHIRNAQQRQSFIEHLMAQEFGEYGYLAKIETGKRTTKQNSALYVYFNLLADALNNAGLEIHMQYLGKSCEVPWTPDSVKERLWRPVQKAAVGTISTTKLDRIQVGKVYEILNRHMAQAHGIAVAFPEKFS